MKYARISVLFTSFLLLAFSSFAQNRLAGKVVDVLDGRTVVIDVSNGKVTAVLQFIEVPEPGQPLNQEVADHLRKLLVGKVVEFKARTIHGGKTEGCVMLNETDMSQQMLRDGAAWLAPVEITGVEAPEREYYSASEAQAKADRLGIWSVKDLKPSWEFRKAKEEKARREEEASWEQYSRTSKTAVSAAPARGIGNAGALISRYNPLTKTGSLETPVLPVHDIVVFRKVAGSFAYLYREDAKGKRTGDFAILFMSFADTAKFRRSDLVISVDGAKIAYAKAKRTERTEGNSVVESMVYKIDRRTVEKIANGTTVILKMGDYPIIMQSGFQMILYNLLDASK